MSIILYMVSVVACGMIYSHHFRHKVDNVNAIGSSVVLISVFFPVMNIATALLMISKWGD